MKPAAPIVRGSLREALNNAASVGSQAVRFICVVVSALTRSVSFYDRRLDAERVESGFAARVRERTARYVHKKYYIF